MSAISADVLARIKASGRLRERVAELAGERVPFSRAGEVLGLGIVMDLIASGYARSFREDGSTYIVISRRILDELDSYGFDEEKIPRDLFADIEGHEEKKRILMMAIRARKPVHILLVGSPGSAKTMFLLELSRLEGAQYILGSRLSKAGLSDFLKETKPRYLIIDELDKVSWRDQSVLLSLMETGILTTTLKTERSRIYLPVKVFAACNYINKIDDALLDRFYKLVFTEYTAEEFIRVAVNYLVNREGVGRELAEYIARSLLPFSKSVREARSIARMAKTKEDVDVLIAEKYRARRALASFVR